MTRKINSFIIFVFYIVLFTSCANPAPAQSPTAAVSSLPPTAPPPTESATNPPPSPTPTTSVESTVGIMQGLAAAYSDHDADTLASYYSENVAVYDATENYKHSYVTVNSVFHRYLGDQFDLKITSFFVTADGQFAVSSGVFYWRTDNQLLPVQPCISLFQLQGGKIVYEFDYYGSKPATGQPLPVQDFLESASQPVSASAQKSAMNLVNRWESAFNERDSSGYLAFYADNARYMNVSDPDWITFDTQSLAAEIKSLFADKDFGQVMQTFYISADGSYAAIQATYKDKKWSNKPMLVILEMKDGRIINQFNYLVFY